MITRQELLDQWRQRLSEAEEGCEGEAFPAWSQRMRARLYRFLLAMYGNSVWPPRQTDGIDNSAGRGNRNQLVVAEPLLPLAGKEPRTRAQILKGLQNVKGLAEELAPAGPLLKGLPPTSPIVVAAFARQGQADAALRKLKQAGFAPEIMRNGGTLQILIAAAEAAPAIDLLKPILPRSRQLGKGGRSHAPQHPLVVLSFWSAVLCGAAGGILTFTILVLAWSNLVIDGQGVFQDPQEVLSIAVGAFGCDLAALSLACIWLLLKQRYSGKPNR